MKPTYYRVDVWPPSGARYTRVLVNDRRALGETLWVLAHSRVKRPYSVTIIPAAARKAARAESRDWRDIAR